MPAPISTPRLDSDSSINPPRTHRDSLGGEQQAHLQLEIARLFLAYGKTAVARRRLKRIAEQYGDSPTGVECRDLLAEIELQSEQSIADLHDVRRLASA